MTKLTQTAGFQAFPHCLASCYTHCIVAKADDIEFPTLSGLKGVKKQSDVAICNPTV